MARVLVRCRPRRGSFLLAVLAASVTIAGSLSAVVDVVPAAAASSTQTSTVSDSTSAQTEAEASAVAAKYGHAVTVLADMTDTKEVEAEPNGSFQLTESTVPVRTLQSGAWTAVDTSLAMGSNGMWQPVASSIPMEFSAGGSGPMAEVQSSTGQWVALSWPGGPLPAPTVTGSVATYSGVLPGVDLILTATSEGVSEVLRVDTASAATNSQLNSLTFGLTGASLSASGPGGAAAAGQVVVPEPDWWDSSSAGATPASPGLQGAARPLPDSVAGQSVTIDGRSALQTPGVVYPVYLDPEVLDNVLNYTYVDHLYPTTSYYDNTSFQHIGYVTAGDGTHIARSFWQENLSNVMGTVVTAATFNVYPEWSYSCTPEPVTLYLVGGISSSTTWNNQPALSTEQDTQTWAQQNPSFPGGNPNTACPTTGNPIFFNATNAVQQAVANNWGQVTLGLFTNEANPLYWKQVSDGATITVGYYHTPGTPTGSVSPCTTSCSSPYTTDSATPTLTGTTTDSDGAALQYQYDLYQGWSSPPSGNPVQTGSQSNVASGAQSTWVPSALADAGYYEYEVRACVNADTSICGSWSSPIEFQVDTTGQPINVQAFAGNGQEEVTWSQSTVTGLPPIDSYVIVPVGPGSPPSTTVSCAHTLYCSNGVVTGLTNGDSYSFYVYAHNSNGYSPPTEVAGTPSASAAPYPVVAAEASAGNGNAYVYWTPGPANGAPAVTGYYVDAWKYNTTTDTCTTTGVGYEVAASTATSFVYTSGGTGGTLTNGSEYCFVVYPYNSTNYTYDLKWTNPPTDTLYAAGTESATNAVIPSATPPPFSPINAQASAGNGLLLVQWSPNPNSSGGPSPTSYVVQEFTYNGDTVGYVTAQTVTAPVTDAVFSGSDATNGSQYLFLVYADNGTSNSNSNGTGNGQSYWDLTNMATPESNLGGATAPTNPNATPADSTAVVTWTAPTLSVSGVTTYGVNVYNASTNALVTTDQAGTSTSTCSTGSSSDPPTVGPKPAPCAVVTGLTNGTSYYFTITSTTAGLNTGTSTDSNTITPAGKPFAPILNSVANVPPAGGQAQVSWTAPPTQANGVPGDNGSPIVSYIITATPIGGGNPNATTITATYNVPSPDPGSYTDTVSGLLNGTTYNVAVSASNGIGTSVPSNVVSFTPAGVPFSPINVQASNVPPAGGEAQVSWSAPPTQSNGVPGNNGSPITSYTLIATPTGGGNVQATSISQTYQVPSPDPGSYSDTMLNLLNGTTYSITVTANNAIGSGQTSAPATLTPAGIPFAPVDVNATSGPNPGVITVSWSPPPPQESGVPGNNGSPITSYSVVGSPGNLQATVTGNPPTTSVSFSGLEQGTDYSFVVTAANAIGPGAASSTSPSVMPGGPATAVTQLSASAGDSMLTVSWQPPASLNGSTVSSYTLSVSPADIAPVTVTGTSTQLYGLVNGTTYTVTVVANTNLGSSAPASTSQTPAGVPFAPSNFQAAQNGNSAALSWYPPMTSSDGTPGPNGAQITQYLITVSPPDVGPFTYTVPTPDPGYYTYSINGGLNPSTTYTFSVQAYNSAGYGIAASSDPVAPPPNESHYVTPAFLSDLPGNPNNPYLTQPNTGPTWSPTATSTGLPTFANGQDCPNAPNSACGYGSTLYKLGMQDAIDDAGDLSKAQPYYDSMEILDFGQILGNDPKDGTTKTSDSTQYGGYRLQINGSNDTPSLLDARNAIYDYAEGWWAGFQQSTTDPKNPPAIHVKIVLGVNNDNICAPNYDPNAHCIPEEFGNLLAFAIQDLATTINSNGWGQHIWVWAGSDTESDPSQGFSPYNGGSPNTLTEGVLLGFDCVNMTSGQYQGQKSWGDPNAVCDPPPPGSTTTHYGTDLQAHFIDFGDTADLTDHQSTDPWNVSDYAQYMTWVLNHTLHNGVEQNVEYLPEIYNQSNANNVTNLNGLSDDGPASLIIGSTSDCPNPTDNQPGIAWTELDGVNPQSEQTVQTMEYSTDINSDSNLLNQRSQCAVPTSPGGGN